jgi:Rrf2 family iron-sulfur cluster assembly transcriptional regulator
MEIGLIEDYAVRMVVYLSQKEGKVVSRKELAEKVDIPLSLLSRIGQMLEIADLVYVQKGRGGGYKLKKKPEEITLLDVIEAIHGKVYLNRCVESPGFCSRAPDCPVHEVWIEINERFRELLKTYDFRKLLTKNGYSQGKKSKKQK